MEKFTVPACGLQVVLQNHQGEQVALFELDNYHIPFRNPLLDWIITTYRFGTILGEERFMEDLKLACHEYIAQQQAAQEPTTGKE